MATVGSPPEQGRCHQAHFAKIGAEQRKRQAIPRIVERLFEIDVNRRCSITEPDHSPAKSLISRLTEATEVPQSAFHCRRRPPFIFHCRVENWFLLPLYM
jgi:hypothetical protein